MQIDAALWLFLHLCRQRHGVCLHKGAYPEITIEIKEWLAKSCRYWWFVQHAQKIVDAAIRVGYT